jgi:amino acid transporter
MNFKALDRGELVASIGGILLGVSLFVTWYSLGNANTVLNDCHGPNGSCTGWAALTVVRYLLLIAAVAPVILAYIILRGHALSWPRGELTAVVALVALVTTLFVGVIDKPGSPEDQISVAIGWWLALVAGLLILVGSVWRSREGGGARRKPPGVL